MKKTKKKYKIMTDEEKAAQIASDICGFTPSTEKWDITGEWGCAEDAALKMAEWKDEQLKKYLEEKADIWSHCMSVERLFRDGVITAVKEIINELFNKKE